MFRKVPMINETPAVTDRTDEIPELTSKELDDVSGGGSNCFGICAAPPPSSNVRVRQHWTISPVFGPAN